MALLADQTREQVRTAAMATIGISIGVSFAVAMVLGPWLAAAFGLSSLFWFTALLALVGLVVLWRVVPQAPRRLRHRDVGIDRQQLAKIFIRAEDRKSTRLNSSHVRISYAVFCLKKKKTTY